MVPAKESESFIHSTSALSKKTITRTTHYATTRNNCMTDEINRNICALLRLSFLNPAVSHIVIDIQAWPSYHVKRRTLYFWMHLNVNIVFFFECEMGDKEKKPSYSVFYVINSQFFCFVEMFCS